MKNTNTEYPATITSPERFAQAQPGNFDGVFDWQWTLGCFGPNVTPTDVDGMIERNGNFVFFETKEPGKPIPEGQRIALRALHNEGNKMLVYVEGKVAPTAMCFLWPKRWLEHHNAPHLWVRDGDIITKARYILSNWWQRASQDPGGKE